jgi:hypothetical protein
LDFLFLGGFVLCKLIVMMIAARPLWTSTELALQNALPRAFGYDMDLKLCGSYRGVKCIIDEFAPRK